MRKRIIGIVVALSILMSYMIVLPVTASAYSPRTSLSDSDCNLIYYRHGSYGSGNGFPRNWNKAGGNCTWYAFGRAWELLGSLPRLCTNNAGAWYQYNINNGYYSYGSTPKLGAIAVWDHWDNNTGHVAVVEEIGPDYVCFSESGWSYTNSYFGYVKRGLAANGTPSYYSNYRFLGYIYILGDSPSQSAPVHVHSWQGHYEDAHPHRYYETCSCGQTAYPGGNRQVASCSQCYPIGNASLTRSFNKTGRTAEFYRNNVSNANSYTLTVTKDGSSYGTYNMSSTPYRMSNLPSGYYSARLTAKNTNTGQSMTVSCDSFRIVDTYPVTYNANGGTNAPAQQTKIQDTSLTLSSAAPIRDHYIFKGWASSKTATTAQYQPGSAYTKNTKITLYAVWEPETYTISFDMNGGKGTADTTTITYGDSMKMPNTIVRESYYLRGWSTRKGATTPDYKLGIDYKLESDMTLYAVWGNSTWSGSVASGFAGGSGTAEDPYQIADASQLAYLANKVNSQTEPPEYEYYILTDNINLRGYDWVPIGVWNNDDYYQSFHGSFDGNGFTISDMSITSTDESYIGLFGYIADTPNQVNVIKNLTVTGDINGINLNGDGYIGAIFGSGVCEVTDCTAAYVNISDIATTGTAYVGGICGILDYFSDMKDCNVNESYIAMQDGTYYAGLCAGFVNGGKVVNCKVNATDEIFGTSAATKSVTIGSIAGRLNGNIEKCTVYAGNLSNNIKMTNGSYVGGAVGYLDGKAELCTVQLKNGPVKVIDGLGVGSSIFVDGSGTSRVGGIVGYSAKNASVSNCKYDGQSISNRTNSFAAAYTGGITGHAIGKELTKLQTNGNKLQYSDMPTRNGYTATWYTDSTFRHEYDFSKDVAENMTLYAKWTEGGPHIWDGSSKEPAYDSATKTYTITNGEELAWISDVSNGVITEGVNFPDNIAFEGYTIELVKDIYLNDTSDYKNWTADNCGSNQWKPIGGGIKKKYNYLVGHPTDYFFEGNFIGNNKCIYGLNYCLFGYNHGTISNVYTTKGKILQKSWINEESISVGVIAGTNKGDITGCINNVDIRAASAGGIANSSSGTISNCYNNGIIFASGQAGGIAVSSSGEIVNCDNYSEVTSQGNAGGIVCENYKNTSYCKNSGKVSGLRAGGITGRTLADSNNALVNSCYNEGLVEGNSEVGGIAGVAHGYDNDMNITNCYNKGNVVAESWVGGIVGQFLVNTTSTNIDSCYNIGNINGSSKVGGIVGMAVIFDSVKSSPTILRYCYSIHSPLYNAVESVNILSTSYKSTSAMKNLANLTGFSTSVWAVDSSINDGYPYLKALADTYTSNTSYTITAVEDPEEAATISKCFANIDGTIYSNSASGAAYSGGIIGFAGGKNKSPATGLLSVGNRISAVTGGSSANAYSGDIYGDVSANALDFNNIYALSSMELAAANTVTPGNIRTSQISATRPAAQIRRSSFLTNVFGPDTYQSLDYLADHPDAVWVVKDGELPELYYNVLRDITISEVENGSVTTDKSQAVDGELVTVSASANDGYELNKIYVNGTEIIGNTFEVNGDSSIYVTFAQKTPEYSVTVSQTENAAASLTNLDAEASLSDAGDGAASLTAEDGSEISVNATAEEEYTVDAIYVNGEEMASDSFIVTDNSVVTMDVASISTDINAQTYDAQDIKNFSAILGGKVDGDENTVRYIRYWITSEPDVIYSTDTEAGSGEYSITVEDLKAETEYSYQMADTGEIKSFTTTNIPDYDPDAPEYPEDLYSTEPMPTSGPNATEAPGSEPTPLPEIRIEATKGVDDDNIMLVNVDLSAAVDGRLIAAMYDQDGRLISAKVKNTDNTKQDYYFTMLNTEGSAVKVMLWDKMKQMELAEAVYAQ